MALYVAAPQFRFEIPARRRSPDLRFRIQEHRRGRSTNTFAMAGFGTHEK
ncbi:MAG: hypothetical protein ABIZ80_07205 [Bryobacteraceae bacterium]